MVGPERFPQRYYLNSLDRRHDRDRLATDICGAGCCRYFGSAAGEGRCRSVAGALHATGNNGGEPALKGFPVAEAAT